MVLNYLRTVLHPERYHGHGSARGPFFEGWYFKLVDAAARARYAVIPGVFLDAHGQTSESFVQVLDGATGKAVYHRYPLEAFQASPDQFDVRVGLNRFRTDFITLDIEGSGQTLRGEVRFIEPQPWPVTLTSPGIMGWYGWIPAMECYHGVLSLDHALAGSLTIDGAAVDFSGGRGYIEKDWGEAFPEAYIWTQTNHFSTQGTSLTASIAVIPWRRTSFVGFIVGLLHDGTLHRFATYTGAVVERLAVTDDYVEWVLRDRRLRLELRAAREQGGLLHAPIRTEMHRRVDETMLSRVEVRLSETGGVRRTLLHDTGGVAALEIHGDIGRLTKA
jgi:hypothetical protein